MKHIKTFEDLEYCIGAFGYIYPIEYELVTDDRKILDLNKFKGGTDSLSKLLIGKLVGYNGKNNKYKGIPDDKRLNFDYGYRSRKNIIKNVFDTDVNTIKNRFTYEFQTEDNHYYIVDISEPIIIYTMESDARKYNL